MGHARRERGARKEDTRDARALRPVDVIFSFSVVSASSSCRTASLMRLILLGRAASAVRVTCAAAPAPEAAFSQAWTAPGQPVNGDVRCRTHVNRAKNAFKSSARQVGPQRELRAEAVELRDAVQQRGVAHMRDRVHIRPAGAFRVLGLGLRGPHTPCGGVRRQPAQPGPAVVSCWSVIGRLLIGYWSAIGRQQACNRSAIDRLLVSNWSAIGQRLGQ